MLKKGLKEFLLSLGLEDCLIFLVCCKLDIDYQIEESLFNKLIKNKIIERDYQNEKIVVNIPIFDFEEQTLNLNEKDEKILLLFEEIENRIDEYRGMFKGIRPKSIGDKKQCLDNLKAWVLKNPNYSFEDILRATRFYIENTETKFISNADNFIFKYDSFGKPVSSLSTILEAINMGVIEKGFS